MLRTDRYLIERSVHKPDVLSIIPIEREVAIIGCPKLFIPNGPILKTTIDEESMHISSQITSSLLLYCERAIHEIRRNGALIPWSHDRDRSLLSIDMQSPLIERPSQTILIFE